MAAWKQYLDVIVKNEDSSLVILAQNDMFLDNGFGDNSASSLTSSILSSNSSIREFSDTKLESLNANSV